MFQLFSALAKSKITECTFFKKT